MVGRPTARLVAAAAFASLTIPLSAVAHADLPAEGPVTQGFHSGHNGVDIAAAYGSPVRNVEAGTVTIAGGNDPRGYGVYVQVRCDSGHIHEYGHLSRVDVSIGQRVDVGDVLGAVGNSGQSTGTHLHWRVNDPAGNGRDPLTYEAPIGTMPLEPAPEPPVPPQPTDPLTDLVNTFNHEFERVTGQPGPLQLPR